MEVGDLLVYFHQRMIGHAIVQSNYIVYQFDRETEQLLDRKSHWREGLPERLPPNMIDVSRAEVMVEGEVLSAYLYFIEPRSPLFPIVPPPTNPCWIVRHRVDGFQKVTVIDAVDRRIIGQGVPPPSDAFSLTGPQYADPCSKAWEEYCVDARNWFDAMGYSTEVVWWPTEHEIQAHIQSDSTAMFYEFAHGNSYGFDSGCSDKLNYDETTPALIETWLEGYAAMPFTFIGSCTGMCETGDSTLSFAFRKGSSIDAVTVGYCNMDMPECDECWYNYSFFWQGALFEYMSEGWTVKAAFDQALADYPSCLSGLCMRFAGDTTLAVVPVIQRVSNEPPVARCKDVTVAADSNCVGVADIDDGSYDPEDGPVWLTQTPPGPYPLGETGVTLVVRDDHEWESTCAGVVTVVDTTPPSIMCPEDIDVEATHHCGTPADDPQLIEFFESIHAIDNCDTEVDVSFERPECFPLGTTEVIFTATDDAGNSIRCARYVNVTASDPQDID